MKKITRDTPLREVQELAPACRCAACSHGCTMGSGFLAPEDLPAIAQFLNLSEADAREKYMEEVDAFNRKHLRPKILRKGKPYGKCIFYDAQKGCTIHQ